MMNLDHKLTCKACLILFACIAQAQDMPAHAMPGEMPGDMPGEMAVTSEFTRDNALDVSRGVIGNRLGSHVLDRTNGQPLNLADLQGKPLVVSMIYTSCYHICPTTTQHLARVVRKARAVLGSDSFNVVSIGFDVHKDSPQMMQFFADRQSISDVNWYFLSTSSEVVDDLAASLGFLYFPTANGFDHLIQTTLIDATGTVYRQIYGIDFEIPLLIEPLKQLILGKPAAGMFETLGNRVKLFCTVYDPAQDKYKFDYSLFIGMFIGFLCVGVVGFQLIKEWRITLNT
jgi:protein SCO1/2